MAALVFPTSPTTGQIYTANGKSWIWDGQSWVSYNQLTALNGVTIDNCVIGGTTPAAASFTTLSASGQTTLTNASGYNVYASGAAPNYFAGAVGIGSVPVAGQSIRIANNMTGSANSMGVISAGTLQSDATNGYYFRSSATTVAASFTLTGLAHYANIQGAFGSGSAVTNQYGYYTDSTLTGATNNYGFYSNIASGTNRWNFYAAGTASNYFAGAVGIGQTSLTGYILGIQSNLTGGANAFGINLASAVQSDVTAAFGYRTSLSTAASVFTANSISHFRAQQGTIGSGSTVLNQYGFLADTTLTGAAGNYGFYSNIASGTGRYNFYAAGTAANYFAGQTTVNGGTAVPAGGSTGAGLLMSSTANLGVFFGSGVPTLSAAQGSLYIRTDGSSTSTRMYINTNGSTTWTNVTTAA